MFHDGDLRSAITQSLTQQKLLTCFIYQEEQAASQAWEDALNEQAELLQAKTVAVKFGLGSQEAGYLNTFCPVEHAPTIIVIQYGAVIEKIEPSTEREEMLERLAKALRSPEAIAVSPPVPTPASEPGSAQTATAPVDPQDQQPPAPDYLSASRRAQRPDATRPARTALERARAAEAEKAAQRAQSEAHQREADKAIAAIASGKGRDTMDARELGRQEARADWVKQQTKRKEQLSAEKQRILQSIESDKQERRFRATNRKESLPASEPLQQSSQVPRKLAGQKCNIQVRLPDGSSIRDRFEATDTLNGAIRTWIKESASAEALPTSAYTFKLIRPPQPSKNLTVEEEQSTLADLDMLPSASLIVVAQASIDSAHSAGLLGMFYAFLASIVNFFSFFLGIGKAVSQEPSQDRSAPGVQSTESAKSSSIDTRPDNVRQRTQTLADSRAREQDENKTAEFYNGNSSAFEGRKDDE